MNDICFIALFITETWKSPIDTKDELVKKILDIHKQAHSRAQREEIETQGINVKEMFFQYYVDEYLINVELDTISGNYIKSIITLTYPDMEVDKRVLILGYQMDEETKSVKTENPFVLPFDEYKTGYDFMGSILMSSNLKEYEFRDITSKIDERRNK